MAIADEFLPSGGVLKTSGVSLQWQGLYLLNGFQSRLSFIYSYHISSQTVPLITNPIWGKCLAINLTQLSLENFSFFQFIIEQENPILLFVVWKGLTQTPAAHVHCTQLAVTVTADKQTKKLLALDLAWKHNPTTVLITQGVFFLHSSLLPKRIPAFLFFPNRISSR